MKIRAMILCAAFVVLAACERTDKPLYEYKPRSMYGGAIPFETPAPGFDWAPKLIPGLELSPTPTATPTRVPS